MVVQNIIIIWLLSSVVASFLGTKYLWETKQKEKKQDNAKFLWMFITWHLSIFCIILYYCFENYSFQITYGCCFLYFVFVGTILLKCIAFEDQDRTNKWFYSRKITKKERAYLITKKERAYLNRVEVLMSDLNKIKWDFWFKDIPKTTKYNILEQKLSIQNQVYQMKYDSWHKNEELFTTLHNKIQDLQKDLKRFENVAYEKNFDLRKKEIEERIENGFDYYTKLRDNALMELNSLGWKNKSILKKRKFLRELIKMYNNELKDYDNSNPDHKKYTSAILTDKTDFENRLNRF